MKKILKVVLTALSTLFLCIGCIHDVESGYVVAKKFVPKHTTRRFDPALKITRRKSYPDRWYIWVADSVMVSRYSVDKEFYNTLQCGQYVKLNKIERE